MRRQLIVGVVVIALLALAGCGRLNRTATLNQTAHTSGAAAAVVLHQVLVKQGLPKAQVTCAKTMIVNVGTRTSCLLTGAGGKGAVRFTFSNSHGGIDPVSVTPY
jgi:hypothetical protein